MDELHIHSVSEQHEENVDNLISMEFDNCETSKQNDDNDCLEQKNNVDVVGETSTPNKSAENFKKPYIGMTFDSYEEGKEYYIEYGRHKGFAVRVRSSQKTVHHIDKVTSVSLVCSRSGELKKKDNVIGIDEISKSSNTVKCGCHARMRILYSELLNKWMITKFDDDHNHKFVTPLKRIRLRTNRHMPTAAKDLSVVFHQENLPIAKVPVIFGGVNMGFNERDCYNHLRKVRLKELEMGDAQYVLGYFQMRQRENPQFFYAIQLDELGCAVNFFWVNARCRMAYQHFGEMVTFDTTYRTNKYKMPFAPFTGVNHHYQTIQFGCALLQDETEETFYWLFKTWLEAMGGRHPVSIITDQDHAMGAAIRKVFPNARHRLCLWHMKKNFGENLSHIYYKKSPFKKDLKRCINFTYTITDFEDKWNSLVEKYELHNNEWMKNKYAIRESWVPVYHRATFYAGMNTTGRSEGVNSFFNDFVSPKTTLREFVVKYDQALKKIIQREVDEDFVSEHKNRVIDEYSLLLKHAANTYTRNMFDRFRVELIDSVRFKSEENEINGDLTSYLVTSKVGQPEQFIVKLSGVTYKGCCQCQLFEFKGLPCKHILKVLVKLEVDEIPSHFILKRWTKGANSFRTMDDIVSEGHSDSTEAFRLSHICRRATQLSCVASKSDILYKMVINGIEELFTQVFEEKCKLESSNGVSPVTETSIDQEAATNKATQLVIQDPHISQAKGRPKDDKRKVHVSSKGRIKSPIELSSTKKKRKCKECEEEGHDRRNCPNRVVANTD